MNRNVLKRGLAWCVVALVLVPVTLAVVLGLGGLLGALGDDAAAAVCGRIALWLGAILMVAVVVTTVASALVHLVPPTHRPARRRRRGRGRRHDRMAADRPPAPA